MDNIAIIITKLNGGGAERCASNLSIELSKQYNVFLIVFDGSNITYPYNGKLVDLKIPNSNNIFNRTINVFKRVKILKKIKKQYKIKCSISLLDGPNLVNVMSKGEDKVIVSIRDRLSAEGIGSLRKKMIVYSSMKSDLTVCLSKMVQKDMQEYFHIPKSKLITIYNHVDSKLLHSLADIQEKPNFIKDSNIYISTMGRLNNQKGQWHLLRVFKNVCMQIPNMYLIILGEGELKESLEKLADDLGIRDNVIFTGYVKNPHNILKYSEMFVFPSLFEGLGNVLLEALAFDMPIISTDCIAGPREILAPNSNLNVIINSNEYAKYGILTPILDKEHFESKSKLTNAEKEMEKAILKLHFDVKLRNMYRENAKSRVKDFDKTIIAEQWIKCIEK